MDEHQLRAIIRDFKLYLLEMLALKQQITLPLLRHAATVHESLDLALHSMDELETDTDRMMSQQCFGQFDDATRALIADELREIIGSWKEQLKRIAEVTTVTRPSRPPFE